MLAALDEVDVPGGPIYSVADMFADPHFRARGLFQQVQVGGEPLDIPAMIPFLSDTPGRTDWPGPEVGAFNEEVYGGLLGLEAGERERLAREGVI